MSAARIQMRKGGMFNGCLVCAEDSFSPTPHVKPIIVAKPLPVALSLSAYTRETGAIYAYRKMGTQDRCVRSR